MQITTIVLDIAKNMFQVHGIDAAEKAVVRRQLRRGQVMKFFEALPTSGPAATTAAFKGRIHGCTRTFRENVRFSLAPRAPCGGVSVVGKS